MNVQPLDKVLATPEEMFGWADELMRQAYVEELAGNDTEAAKDRAHSTRLYQLAVEMERSRA